MKKTFFPVKPVRRAPLRSNPKPTTFVLTYGPYFIIAQAEGVLGIMTVPGKGLRLGIESIEARIGADPQLSGSVFIKGSDPVAGYRFRVTHIVFVIGEAIAVVLVEAVFRPEPQEPLAVLEHAFYRIDRQAVRDGNPFNGNVLLLGVEKLPWDEEHDEPRAHSPKSDEVCFFLWLALVIQHIPPYFHEDRGFRS